MVTKVFQAVTNPTLRLSAIMFTDMVGYTAMMGEDQSRALRVMKLNQKIHLEYFKRFNCTYHKQMGDGFMAVFNSVSEAVYAVSHILRETNKQNINIRVGIHEGDVIFEDNDVYGDGVNIASRLEQMCKPGSIYVSESVNRNLSSKPGIKTNFVEDATLKNVKEKIRVYEINIDPKYLPQRLNSNDRLRMNGRMRSRVLLGILSIALLYIILNIPLIHNSIFSDSTRTTEIVLPGNSIAILPFVNQGVNHDFDYLGIGLADGILTKLSSINDYTIVSRSSSFKFNTSDKSLSEIAETLGVDMILEGSYQIINEEIRINAKLVGVKENRNLLAETYSGDINNIFKLQDNAAEGLFKLLGKKVNIRDKEEKSITHQPKMASYKYYQEGLSLTKKEYVYKSDISKSRELFRQAIEQDPLYIEPIISLGETFFLEIFFGYNSIYFVKDSIDFYLDKALEMDPDNGQLLTMYGAIKYYQFKFDEAERLVNRGIEKNPNYPFSYFIKSWLDLFKNDNEAQLININKALALDPLNSQFKTAKTIQFIIFSDYKRAQAMIDASLANQPGNNMGLFLKGVLLSQQKEDQLALDVLLERSVGEKTNFLVAYANGKAGNRKEAQEILNYLIEKEKEQYIPPTMISLAYLGLDQYDQSLEWLEKAYAEQDIWSSWILMKMYEPLYNDEQFISVAKKNGLFPTLKLINNTL